MLVAGPDPLLAVHLRQRAEREEDHAGEAGRDLKAASAKVKLLTLGEEIIAVLAADSGATVSVTVEISARFPGGVPDHVNRAVSENAAQLGFKIADWE